MNRQRESNQLSLQISQWARSHPERIAIKSEHQSVSYLELESESNRIANFLHEKHEKEPVIANVIIILDRSPQLIQSMIALLKCGLVFVPVDPFLPSNRMKMMIQKSQARWVITTNDYYEKYKDILDGEGEAEGLNTLLLDRHGEEDRRFCLEPGTGHNELTFSPVFNKHCYIYFTSGSTGTPKGILGRQSGLYHFIRWEMEAFGVDETFNVSQMTPPSFDVVMRDIFLPLMAGGTCCIPPRQTLLNMRELIQWIDDNKITLIHTVPSLFKQLVSEIREPDCFLGLKYIVLAGELLRGRDIHPFISLFEQRIQLINIYGPTETTLAKLFYPIRPGDENRSIIPVGKAIDGAQALILDSTKQKCRRGKSGEIYIRTPFRSAGYYNDAELTQSVFIKNPFGKHPDDLIYKTGDLGRQLPDGNVEISGRADFQVKIRGVRIETGEIENRLLAHPGVRDVVVNAAMEPDGEKYLCAYVKSTGEKSRLRLNELKEYLAGELPEAMIPAYFVHMDSFPLTPSGKIDRKALPEPVLEEDDNYVLPADETEEKLLKIWSDVLRRDESKIGVESNFFQLGGHSLRVAAMASKIHQQLNVNVPMAQFFKTMTIRELSQFLQGVEKEQHTGIEPVEKKEYYPLSSAQKRLYILQMMDENSIAYNMPRIFKLEGNVDTELLATIFQTLAQRHESFRTFFHIFDEEPIQRIHPGLNLRITTDRVQTGAGLAEADVQIADFIGGFIIPFDLAQAPLFRVGFVILEDGGLLLMVDMHHITSDGTSMGLLGNELIALYEGRQLPGLTIQYKDFALWEARQQEKIRSQASYWIKEFSEEVPALELPLDYSRPKLKQFAGDLVVIHIDAAETAALKSLSLAHGTTLYMVLLSLYNIFLAKVCNKEIFVVGTPTAGRNHADLDQVVGMFVNTLLLKNAPAGEKSFSGFLAEVKENTLRAYANQDYQYEELVDQVMTDRDMGRNPLFDTMLALQNMDQPDLERIDLNLTPYPHAGGHTSKFDLSLMCLEVSQQITCAMEYDTSLFKEASIHRFIRYFKVVVGAVLENAEVMIRDIRVISREEREQILFDFNFSDGDYAFDKTIHQLFEEQAARTPDHIAVTGLRRQLSYSQLNRQSAGLAVALREKGAGRDSIIGLMLERSIEQIIGLLAILKAGGAYLPMDSEYPPERIDYMLRDSCAKLVVTGAKEVEVLSGLSHDVRPVFVDTLSVLELSQANLPASRPSDLVFMIYTSGSTGKPKGVMLEHRNLVNLLEYQFKYTNLCNRRVLQFATISFDASFHEIFTAFLSGGQLFLVSEEIRTDIPGLFKLMDRNLISTVFLPISFLKVIFKEQEYINQFPSSITHIQTAGDQVVVSDNFRNYLKENDVYLHNHYGPTETHVVTVLTIDPRCEIPELPTIGKPIMNSPVYIMDRSHHLLPVGTAGELWLGGVQVGRGYFGKEELSREKFLADPFIEGQRVYRSGDLGRWLSDGNIEFLGRMDDQVKIRGFRVEMGEIESRLSHHPEVQESVVLARRDEKGDLYLCAYVVAEQEFIASDLLEFLAKELPDYMVPAYFVQMETIPVTHNRKVDRRALPEPERESRANYIAPGNETERKLTMIWSQVLDVVEDKISIGANFFELGGHSLKAMIMTSKIHKVFSVRVPLAEVFKLTTIRGLARYIEVAERQRYLSVEPVEEKSYYRLSSAQKRLYFLQVMDEGIGYNISQVMRLKGGVDVERLTAVFNKLIQRHESLRTSFHMVEEELVQRIHNLLSFNLFQNKSFAELFQKRLPEGPPEALIKSFIRPFDLSQAPLLRVGLVEMGEDEFLLMVDMHHIISDGVSMGVLTEEFLTLYDGGELPSFRLHYKDYAEWESCERAEIKRQEAFWLEEFSDEIPVLDLPLDYSRPSVQDFAGDTVGFNLDSHDTQALNSLALGEGATLYMVLLSIYNIFLSKLSNQGVIVVGTPTAGRRHADLEKVIGMFVNTLAMKNSPGGEKSFRSLLGEVKEKTLNAFANQDYQYEELVEKVMVNRDTGRNPLFDTMFMLQNMVSPVSGPTSGLKLEPYPFEKYVSKFDLSLSCFEMGDCISCTIEYGTSLFKRENIQRFAGFFKKIVTAVAANPDAKMASLEIISPEEREKILYDFNDTAVDYPGEKTITQLFEQQVERRPDAVAIKGKGGVEISYLGLNEKADQLAAYLSAKGVMPDTIVGLKVERRIEMFIGLLGILKTGASYLPIDPVYPQERIDYMLKESNTKYLLTTDEILKVTASTSACEFKSKPGTLAYVIYTSGSSGRPKGVAIEHRNVLNFITGMTDVIDFSAGKSILAVTTICFDIFVLESFLPLLQGMEIVLADETEQGDPLLLMPLIEDNGVDMVQFTPSRLQLVVNISPELRFLQGVKELLVGGEALPQHLFETLKQHFQGKIYNVYGPTETTVWSTVKDLTACREITIGKPIANTQIYILSNDKTLQPIGIAGELCIAGDGVARGYLNQPEMTDEKFTQASGGSPRGRFCKSSAKLLVGKRFEGQKIYGTGDLARWLGDGDIECLGRIDNQVKIRGFRIELGEIENQLLSNKKVKETVVIAGEARNDGDKYLCAYIVFHGSADQPDASELRSYLVDRLPGYMLPSYFVSLPELPLTPNGKLNRRALPDPETGNFSDNYVPPRNTVEMKLAHIWSCLLSVEEEKIGIHDNFFGMGGHSLKVTGMAARIEKEFGVKIKMAQVFKSPTISGLAGLIEKSAKSEYTQIELVEEREYYLLSSAQKRMYFIHEMDGGTGYNMPGIMALEGKVDVVKLEDTFKQLISRHESFRTSFHMIDEQPVQRVSSFNLSSSNLLTTKSFAELFQKRLPEGPPEALIKSFIRPFDLSQAPLLRVGLVEIGDNESLLMVDMHHIISDGISLELLVKEFMTLYCGEELPAMRLRYRDYAWSQYHGKRSEQLLQQEQYWGEEFAGEVPVLSLPTDYMRPVVRDFSGDRICFSLDSRITAGIKSLVFQSGSTVFIVLTAIYNLFLAKVSNQEDIVIGTPTSGRRHADLEKVIGMFVNTVALRNFPVSEKRFSDFLKEVKEKTFAAFENQEYQYEELIDKLEIRRDTGRNPLFDTVFTLRNFDEGVVEIPGLKIRPLDWESKTTKFDLSLSGVETGDELLFTFRYCTKLFKRETMDTFILFFKEIASSVTVNPGQTLYEAQAIPSNRKQEILSQLYRRIRDGFESPIRPVVSLQEKLRDGFERFGSSVAIESVDGSFSYDFLDGQSDAIANVLLVEKSVEAGTMIGVLMEKRINVIFALLAILKVRCIFVPLDPALPEQRRQTMIDSLGLELILCDDDIPLKEMRSIEHPVPLPVLSYSLEDPVYVYFTSGSTGVPRALLGKNSSLLHFIQWEIHRFSINPGFRFSQVITPVFDAFLRDVFAPLCSGGVICIPPTYDTSGQLVSWLNRVQISLIHCVPAFFRSLMGVDLDATDFKSLRYILMSGEPVVPVDLEKWYNVMGGRVQLVNLWGPSETTLIKSSYLIEPSDSVRERVPVGLPMEGSCTLVLDDQGGLCDTLVVGELYIRTPFGTAGYLNDPLSNRQRFVPLPGYLAVEEEFERETGLPDLLHKTGDLGRLLPNGMIDVLGRNDRQVKIRGIRVELGEIERVMMKYRGVKESVVTFRKLSDGSSDEPGRRMLCAYITCSSAGAEVVELETYLRGVLPDYMVPVHIMRLEFIPRKANLKVDYDGLPHPLELDSVHFRAPRTETESRVREIWSDLLGMEADKISVDRLFFELGGNSLSIMTLNSRLHREFNVRLPLAEVFGNATIEKLAVLLDGAGEEVYRGIVPVEQREYYPLSSAQRRLYFLQMMEGGTGYNMPRVMRLTGRVDVGKLEETFKQLISRHESFRTSFHMINEEPVQKVSSFNLLTTKSFASLFQKRPLGEPPEALIKKFIRPFDLSQAPLLRVGLVELGEGDYLFMVDMHHIISDGTSIGVLVGEFMTLYDGGHLPLLRLHYKDYAQWESDGKERIGQQESFWLNEFSDEIPVLDLPLDYSRPAVRDFSGDVVRFELSVEETDALNALALEQGVTLYMVLFTIYNIFLGRVANRETIVVGTPTAGRRHADLEKVIGMFVNTLALKSVVSADRSFLSLLAEVKEKTLSAFSNQDYQYEELVDKVMSTRDAGRNPLFDTMFILQNMESTGIETSSLKLGPFSHERHVSKFDLSLICIESKDHLYGLMEYSTALFKQETICRFISYFKSIIGSVLERPAAKISALEMIRVEERDQLLFHFNDTAEDYPRDKTVHQLFAEQVERVPDHIVLSGDAAGDGFALQVSYGELARRAYSLSCYLRAEGVGVDTIVGVLGESCADTVVGIMGILMAGAAYLPVNPNLPPARIEYILKDSAVPILLSSSNSAYNNSAVSFDKKVILLYDEEIYQSDPVLPAPVSLANHLAYVIYTSGSTGWPKGVAVEHGHLVNFISHMAKGYDHGIGVWDRCLSLTNIMFDVSVWEFFLPLSFGAGLVFMAEQEKFDVYALVRVILAEGITLLYLPPGLLKPVYELLQTHRDHLSLNKMLVGVEPIRGEVLDDYMSLNPGMQIINGYGPTETTICCTSHTYSPVEGEKGEIVPIGLPIANSQVVLLGGGDVIAPRGIAGEICVSGACVSRGYINNPELTAEKYTAHPYLKGKRMYRTGDMARWLTDGNLRFLGRRDTQLKIRGYRIELGEIENQLLSHDRVKAAVLRSFEDGDGDKYLCAYFIDAGVDTGVDAPALKEYLTDRLPGYMVPACFVAIEKIPLTANGKVDINALPVPQRERVDLSAGPRNQIEKKMVEIWSGVLGKESIGIHDDFFSVGGDSIKSIQIISRMNGAGYKVEMKDIFQYPAIAQLSAHVKPLKRSSDQLPVTGIVPLTPIQHLFFKSAGIDSHHFNQAVMFHGKEGFDKESVIRVFTRIQEHHDALRMTYTTDEENGAVKQVNQGPDYPLCLEEFNPEHQKELNERVNQLQSSIDLEKGPLMKLGLFHMDDGDRLLVVIHHLVVDGVSWRILFEDIAALYEQILKGSKPALPLKSDSFKFWSEKLQDYAGDKNLLREISYWNRVESQAAGVIKRDFDAKGNAVKDTRRISFGLDEEKTALLLNNVNRCYNTEINDILLTALGMAVSELTAGPEAVLITLEGHGREEIFDGMDISRTVGWFTTVYPVLLDMSHAGDTGRQIMEVKETLRKIPNKGIGYGILKHLSREEMSRHVKPQIIFNYLGQFDTDVKGLKMAEESSGKTQGPDYQREHDLEISGMIANNRLSMNLTYNETHFRAQTIEGLANHFHGALEHLITFCSAKESIQRTPSDFTYKELTIQRLNRLQATYGGGDIEDIYILSPMQEGMLFHSLADHTSAAYFQQTAFRLQGALDIPIVEKSVNQLLQRHPVLRTAFVHKDCPRPLQVVLKERPVDFYYQDMRLMGDSKEKEAFVGEFKAGDKKKTFDLSDDTLVRVSILRLDTAEYEFTWSFHHILMDGWCIGILNQEFFEIYSSNLENRSYGLPQAPPPYRTYIQWLEKQDKESSGRYWENVLAGFEEQTSVVPVQTDSKSGYNNQSISFTLDKDKTAKLNNLASGKGVTLNILNQVVWGILLGKTNGKEDIVFGTVVSGRPSDLEGVETMVGLFINTIPVRIRFEDNMKFHTLLQTVQQEALWAEPHHHYPLAAIQARTPLKQDLLDHLFVFENYPVAEQIEGYEGKNENGASITNVDVFEQTTYNLNIVLAATGLLRISFKYNANVVEEDYVKALVRRYQLLLDQVTTNEDVAIDELTLLSPEDKERILYEFNATAAPYPHDKSIQQLFEEQVIRNPDHIALLGPDRTDMSCLSYGHLNERAGQLAAGLIEKGVRPGGIVAIMVERSVDMVIGSLAILKAGGCYMPINPSYPKERIDFLLKNSNACYCLDSKDYTSHTSHNSHRSYKSHNSYNSQPAYIMHTSGSTGNPKGVIVTHRNVIRLVKNTNYVEFVAGQKILQTGALDFDASTFEMWGALLNGLSLVLVDKATMLTPQKFKWCLKAYDVATIFLTTALFSRMLQEDAAVFSGLKNLLVGGEVMPTSHMNRLRRTYPGLNIIHCYGPTENTTFSTTWPVLREYDRHVPIGKPIANSTAYVLDKSNRLQAIGIPGQLALGGEGVAQGYLNSPELTAEKFVNCPSIDDRLYKSGDLVRWLADGTIEFIGRMDEQVKIRGFRIELGEIKNQLSRHPAVKETAVTARKEGDRKYLCAYYTLNNDINVDINVDKAEVKEFLERTLPAYMVPACFVKLDSIPLNPNGKVYRGKLPQPTDEDFVSSRTLQEHTTDMQRTIAAVWKEILGRERIGIRDNFFDLGGNSLDLVALSNKLRQKLNREIPVAALMDNPTISSLAHVLTSAERPGIAVPENFVLLSGSPRPTGNLFMVHEMFGDVGVYMEFSKQLPGFNIWGVESEKRSHYAPVNAEIETIAAGYIRQIKTIQPQGPYNLAAWSWGGHILFEMALQLEKMGEKLSLLTFMDCFGPDYKEAGAPVEFNLESETELLKEFFAGNGNQRELEEIDDMEQLWVRALEILTDSPVLVAEVRQLLKEKAPGMPDYDGLTAGQLVQFLNTSRIHSQAGSAYVPEGKIHTVIDYFLAARNRNKEEYWQDLCLNPIVYHELDADHQSMFRNKEHLSRFAAKFNSLLLNIHRTNRS